MSKIDEIYSLLERWNIGRDQIEIDWQAEDILLIALNQNPKAVYLDEENALIIEPE